MPADESASAAAIELQPFFHDVKNTIVQPKQIVVGTRYFWEKWAPRLGPTLTVLIVRLRMHCYYNQATQERRDWCFPTQQTLAEEAGVSRWTVMRELKKPEARQFVRVQLRSRYDAVRRQTVRISSLYHVAMDDPLIEEDHGRAAAMLVAGAVLQKAEERQDPHCGIVDAGRQVEERAFTGKPAETLVANLGYHMVHIATGPSGSKMQPEKEPEDISPDVDVIARELIEEQVTTGVAHRLARQFPAEVIREKMALVKQLAQQQQVRSPGGLLRRAIEDNYELPLAPTGTDGRTPLLELRTSRATCMTSFVMPPRLPATGLGGTNGNLDVWQATKSALAAEMRPAVFAQWLEPSKLLHYEIGRLSIVVPDIRIQRYIEQRLRPTVERALNTACGTPTNLEIIVEGDKPECLNTEEEQQWH